MGKNTFQSLVMAASMLGMSANSAPAQGSGDKIAETKGAIEALISSLPPDQFKVAIKVLEGDEALLDDGIMDTKDTATIRDHASKLLGISKDAAQKVLDSLNPHGVAPAKKTESKIGETPAEKNQRLEKERLEKLAATLVNSLNRDIIKPDKWASLKPGSAGVDAEVEIKKSNGSLKFSIGKGKALGQATIQANLLAGKYKVDLEATSGEIIIWSKGLNTITLINGVNLFELPQNIKVDICVKPGEANPSIEVGKFIISQEENQKIAGK